MKKFCLKIGILIPAIVVSFFLFAMPVYAQSNDYEDNNDYRIDAYNVSMSINQKNVYSITETITAYFSEPRHGLYRYIPVRGMMHIKCNGKTENVRYRAKISDVSICDGKTGLPIHYKEKKIGDNLEFIIGDKNVLFSNTAKTYTIHYNYDMGNCTPSNYDAVCYDVIGYGWDTKISNVTFSVDMPKQFNTNQLSVASEHNVKYKVSGNTITGNINELDPEKGLTLTLLLPKGYFIPTVYNDWIYRIILFSILSILSIVLFLRYGKSEKIYPILEVAAPNDINPAEAGFIIRGKTADNQFVALLMHWANKGYIKISAEGKDNYAITKLQDPEDDMSVSEQKIFADLLTNNKKAKKTYLKYKFFRRIGNASAHLYESFCTPERQLYSKLGTKIAKTNSIFASLCIGIMIGAAVSENLLSLLIGSLVGLAAYIITRILCYNVKNFVRANFVQSKFRVLCAIIVYILVLSIAGLIAVLLSKMSVEIIIAVVSAAICGTTGVLSNCKRTEQGQLWLARLAGLMKFIYLTEKDKIEKMSSESPSFFFDIFPYAYILGIENEWVTKFENIALEPPTWYNIDGKFNLISFCSQLDGCLKAMGLKKVIQKPLKTYGVFWRGSIFHDIITGGSGGGAGGGGGGSW